MKYHVLFLIFEKSGKICIRRLLQIIGGALWVKVSQHGNYVTLTLSIMQEEHGGSVVQYLTQDGLVVGLNLTRGTAMCP